MSPITRRGLALVVSAPSGAGKTSLARALLDAEPNLALSVSATTRPPRPGERDGVHYHFLTVSAFEAMAASGELLESAHVFGHWYGTPRASVEAALAAGRDMLFDIDWQGYRQVRTALEADVVGLFLLPPTVEALRARLVGRGSDDAEVIARRMQAARAEMAHASEFHHVVVNADFAVALAECRAVLHAARLATGRLTGLARFLADMGE